MAKNRGGYFSQLGFSCFCVIEEILARNRDGYFSQLGFSCFCVIQERFSRGCSEMFCTFVVMVFHGVVPFCDIVSAMLFRDALHCEYIVYTSKPMAFFVHRLFIQDCVYTWMDSDVVTASGEEVPATMQFIPFLPEILAAGCVELSS